MLELNGSSSLPILETSDQVNQAIRELELRIAMTVMEDWREAMVEGGIITYGESASSSTMEDLQSLVLNHFLRENNYYPSENEMRVVIARYLSYSDTPLISYTEDLDIRTTPTWEQRITPLVDHVAEEYLEGLREQIIARFRGTFDVDFYARFIMNGVIGGIVNTPGHELINADLAQLDATGEAMYIDEMIRDRVIAGLAEKGYFVS